MKQRIGTNRRTLVLAAGAAGMAALSGLAGCTGYANYPPAPGTTWVNARDTASIRVPMARALEYVINEDLEQQTDLDLPESGPIVAINVPGGIASTSYRWIAEHAHPRAVPMSESNTGLPIYHVAAVRIRADVIRVDVLRPISGLEQNVENPVYAGAEVWFKPPATLPRFDHIRRREVGTIAVPMIVPIEAIERAEAERQADVVPPHRPSRAERAKAEPETESGTE